MKMQSKYLPLAAASMLLLTGLSWFAGSGGAQAQSGPDLLKQMQPTPEMIKSGDELFKANCAACHGPTGMGDGQPALHPRNFHAKTGWKNGQGFAQMYKTLEEGLPGTAMSSFSQLPPKDRVALINHIRALAPSNFPPVTAADAETLQKDFKVTDLSKSGPAAVPVDKAIELLIKEAEPQNALIKSAYAKLMAADDAGSELIKDSTTDPRRALSLLVNASAFWKGSTQDFAKMVLSDPDVNGFKAETGNYSSAQWQSLQNALKKLL